MTTILKRLPADDRAPAVSASDLRPPFPLARMLIAIVVAASAASAVASLLTL